MIRVSILAKMPAPYRVRVFDEISAESDIDATVTYLSAREPDREWQVSPGSARSVFIKPRIWTVAGKYVHVNPAILWHLARQRPHVVITSGYNITDLLAVAYCAIFRAKHISQTDGTDLSEKTLTVAHRIVRKMVRLVTSAYIGPSLGSQRLFLSFGAAADSVFLAPLAVDNSKFQHEGPENAKKFDLLFSSRFVGIKNPHFVLDVALALSAELGRHVSVAMLGSGELWNDVERAAKQISDRVEVTLPGFVQQEDLPEWFHQARVFLFPTSWDPWGVVANEACAAGLPVLTTPAAGVAGELVLDGENGFVLPLESEEWAIAAAEILRSDELRRSFARRCKQEVDRYTFEAAASGYVAAIRFASHGRTVGR